MALRTPALNVVHDTENGRQVISRIWGRDGLEETVFTFGDVRPDLAEALNALDPNKDFQCGFCADLANAIASRYDFGLSEVYVDDESIHWMARTPDGEYVDSLGVWTAVAMWENWILEPGQEVAIVDHHEDFVRRAPTDLAAQFFKVYDPLYLK